MEFENENIAGYRLDDGTIVCAEHVTPEEDTNAELDDFIMFDDIENGDKRYCCIRCKKQL